MIAFRVTINGKPLATAGIKGGHVLTAIVNSTAGTRQSGAAFQNMWMHLGGLASGDHEHGEGRHVTWLPDGRKTLKVGDEIVVQIVEVDVPDKPVSEKPAEPRSPVKPATGQKRRG